ncbi:hypothetical protein H9L01_03090 [Erysipelothrix inopinata]|uniref:Uncharacterized protein n=1 Tax=Erysipelothrix inopinata TaxID=225084 RepID=A0A7G9S0J3_9FIRM|nr:hypothetical protein [Erysipelothrix inopinata]QNN61368.1 hypothetical protein H9L01_03090 [Erysipelothrix inopinata]
MNKRMMLCFALAITMISFYPIEVSAEEEIPITSSISKKPKEDAELNKEVPSQVVKVEYIGIITLFSCDL